MRVNIQNGRNLGLLHLYYQFIIMKNVYVDLPGRQESLEDLGKF
jgi:uncharacterized membrane protein YjgN (DUF898 family)